MTETEQMLYMLMGLISEMPQEEQDEITSIADCIRGTIEGEGDKGFFALSLVAAEGAIKNEQMG